jgi:hypothetical protein
MSFHPLCPAESIRPYRGRVAVYAQADNRINRNDRTTRINPRDADGFLKK